MEWQLVGSDQRNVSASRRAEDLRATDGHTGTDAISGKDRLDGACHMDEIFLCRGHTKHRAGNDELIEVDDRYRSDVVGIPSRRAYRSL